MKKGIKNELYILSKLTSRNLKIFLKDKAAVFFSLLAPMIVLLLNIMFLGDIQIDGAKSFLPKNTDIKAIEAFVNNWMMSGVLSVACITVALSSNSVMVQDKTRGILHDCLSAPIKRRVVIASYFIYNFIVTLFICTMVFLFCLIYLVITKTWALTFVDVLSIYGNMILAILSATFITVFICNFFKSEATLGAFNGIVSAIIGFMIGAYMPLAMMPKFVQYIACFFPGLYSTCILRNAMMQTSLNNLSAYVPNQVLDEMGKSYSMRINFFGADISIGIMYLIVTLSTLLFIILNIIFVNKKKIKE